MIGKLNKRITIQEPTETSDGMGSFTTVWSDLHTLSGAIWPVSANELVRSMQTTMEITHRIRIRYQRWEVKPKYRIKFTDAVKGARYFNIVSITNPNEKQEWLDILAKEVVS